MEGLVFQRLESYLSQARVILFIGAGFSMDAKSKDGDGVPGVREITQKLWGIAFPSDPYDESPLSDVYEAAIAQAQNRSVEMLRATLTVAPESLPDHYRTWFSLPWYRVYTLNIDDLAEATNHAFALPRPIESVSALTSSIKPTSQRLQVVHLNGSLQDLPNVTFGSRQYAERLAHVDVWYANLARELVSHPVIFVGTSLNESPLWQYIEMRGPRTTGSELRPGSFLVTKDLGQARRVALKRYNIELLSGTAESFATDTLSQLQEASKRGFVTLSKSELSSEDVLLHHDARSHDSIDDEREFLMGREPRWSDFSATGFAAGRDIDNELATLIENAALKLVAVTGTAGSGKSATAMRLVLFLRGQGKSVVVLNEDADLRAHRIRHAIEHAKADVLYIEDLERLGRQDVIRVLDDLFASGLQVIATVRSAAFERMGLTNYLNSKCDATSLVVPLLTDGDIDSLLDALDRANRPGALRGKPRAEQHQILASKCGRQLLVAMIEATSGKRFDVRIDSECRELSPASAAVYAVVALATTFRIRIDRQMLITALGGDSAQQMELISELERTHLLARDRRGRLTLRHRMIAEKAVDFFRRERLVETPFRGLTFALAVSARPGDLRSTRDGQALIRLINHDRVIDFFRSADEKAPDTAAIRSMYQELESLLSQDHHFWLQRGSFETEAGDIELAKNFIEQARGLAPEDPYVRTEWAYMTLKRASRRTSDPNAIEEVRDAFTELEDVIGIRGRYDSYQFHVYGSQGLAWAKRSGMTNRDKQSLLLDLRRMVDKGLELHSGNGALEQLAKDLEREYLLIATD